jgi:death-on-curing family protein
MADKVWTPTAQQVVEIHEELVSLFEADEDPISPSGVKSEALLDSACERPKTSLGGVEKYTTTPSKLAALFHSLTKNHPFHNGNKRTAVVTLLTALHRNDLRLKNEVDDEKLYDFVLAVTSDTFPTTDHGLNVDDVVSEVSTWIRDSSEAAINRPGSMRMTEFAEKCRRAGANCKDVKGGAISIGTQKGRIRISKSTSQLSGPVVRTYLQRLGLSAAKAGFDMAEFQEGVNPEREQIHRFMMTLRRLAKT